jgi:hypothetical protein
VVVVGTAVAVVVSADVVVGAVPVVVDAVVAIAVVAVLVVESVVVGGGASARAAAASPIPKRRTTPSVATSFSGTMSPGSVFRTCLYTHDRAPSEHRYSSFDQCLAAPSPTRAKTSATLTLAAGSAC